MPDFPPLTSQSPLKLFLKFDLHLCVSDFRRNSLHLEPLEGLNARKDKLGLIPILFLVTSPRSMHPALRPTPTVPETPWDFKRGHPTLEKRQDPPSVTNCMFYISLIISLIFRDGRIASALPKRF